MTPLLRQIPFDSNKHNKLSDKLSEYKEKHATKFLAHPQKTALIETGNWITFAMGAAKQGEKSSSARGMAIWMAILAVTAYFYPLAAAIVAASLAAVNFYISSKAFDHSVLNMELADEAAFNVFEQHSMMNIDPFQHDDGGYPATIYGDTAFNEKEWLMGSEYEVGQLRADSSELYELKKSLRYQEA